MKIPQSIIIDDDIDSIKLLSHYINKYCSNIEIVGTAQNVEEGVLLIDTLKPDFIFLDIMLGDNLGFDLLEVVSHKDFQIIFMSSFEEYVIKSFKYSPVNFLMKPISIVELKTSVNWAIEKITENKAKETKNENDFIAIPVGNKVLVIKLANIWFCKSEGNYTQICIDKNEKILAANNLGYYEEKFKTKNFIRTHKSYLINIDFIKCIHKSINFYCELINGEIIPISRRKQKEIQELLHSVS